MRNRLTLNAIRNYEWAPTERQPGGHCLDCETLNPLRVYDTYVFFTTMNAEVTGQSGIFLLGDGASIEDRRYVPNMKE